MVTPLLGDERVGDEGFAVAARILGRMLRPALHFRLEGVIAVIQLELLPGHGRLADAQLNVIPIEPAATALAAIGPKSRHRHTQRLTGLATGTLRVKHGVSEAPPTLL